MRWWLDFVYCSVAALIVGHLEAHKVAESAFPTGFNFFDAVIMSLLYWGGAYAISVRRCYVSAESWERNEPILLRTGTAVVLGVLWCLTAGFGGLVLALLVHRAL